MNVNVWHSWIPAHFIRWHICPHKLVKVKNNLVWNSATLSLAAGVEAQINIRSTQWRQWDGGGVQLCTHSKVSTWAFGPLPPCCDSNYDLINQSVGFSLKLVLRSHICPVDETAFKLSFSHAVSQSSPFSLSLFTQTSLCWTISRPVSFLSVIGASLQSVFDL